MKCNPPKVSLTCLRHDDEQPRAYVVLKQGRTATANDIVSFLDGKVARIKRITGGVVFVQAIPKNPSGKIIRNLLRDRAKKETVDAPRL